MLPTANLSTIERLAAAAGREQWRVEDVVVGDARPALPAWAPRVAIATAVGLLRDGERAAEAACLRLIELLPAGPAADFVRLQAADETRHAAAYARYLDLLGARAAPSDAFEPVHDAMRARNRSPHALVLVNHLILEDAALGVHHWLARRLPCPLLCRIVRRVGRDEARHVAFGRWFARGAVAAITEPDRRADLAWARDVRARCMDRVAALLGPMSPLLAPALPGFAARHAREQDAALDALMAGPRAAVRAC